MLPNEIPEKSKEEKLAMLAANQTPLKTYLSTYSANFSVDIDVMWKYHDIDKNGYLDREEARTFVFEISECIDRDRALCYDPAKFDSLFDRFDENDDKFLSKSEMAAFIKKVFNKQQEKDGKKKSFVPISTPRRKKGERKSETGSGKKTISYVDDKYIKYTVSNNFENPIYDDVYESSISNKEKFWSDQAQELVWTKNFKKVLNRRHPYLQRWFPDGEMNICYNCVDRHVDEGRGDQDAFVYDSAYTGVKQTFTYKQVQDNVSKMAAILKYNYLIGKGDRVLIYMPMVPPAAWAMLACARIGAIHSVVFGGFAAKELANRIDDC